jgi:inner membrane protein
MDIVTQGVLGAALAQSAAKKEHVRLATIIGLVAGVIADADILIRSASDPLLSLEFHRHFTHSIFFIPFGAAIAFLLLWPFLRNKLSAACLYLYCFMGFSLSGFIDACTSYGTYLLWPLIDERISWHIISIVDPVFTITLIAAIVIGYKKTSSNFSRIGLVLAGFYLLFTFSQMHRAEKSIIDLAAQRGHTIEKIIVKPTIGNALLWRSVYLSNDTFYVDAVRAGLSKRIYQGDSIKQFNMAETFPELDTNSLLAEDIQRFEIFSDNYVSQYPGRPEILGDVRYSMKPLWGIEMNLDDTSQHVKFDNYRDASKVIKQKFINMLLNRTIKEERLSEDAL